MIEFTLSRVCMCVCGVLMLAAATGYLGLVEDQRGSEADQELADDIASMLDAFQMSKLNELRLDGSTVLPSNDIRVVVHDGLVELIHGDRRYYSSTVFGSDLELDRGSSVVLTRSVTEGLGDVANGVGEDVHLLETVVEVDGCPRASVDTA
ncbi:MAG: hypothetical protein ACI38Y_06105 [Candidatus Methanomethylophilaceae archaeon]